MSTDFFAPFSLATREEIQRAHDLLHSMLNGDIAAPVQPENLRLVWVAHDALSWVLGFECGEAFRSTLSGMLAVLKNNGATIWRSHPPA